MEKETRNNFRTAMAALFMAYVIALIVVLPLTELVPSIGRLARLVSGSGGALSTLILTTILALPLAFWFYAKFRGGPAASPPGSRPSHLEVKLGAKPEDVPIDPRDLQQLPAGVLAALERGETIQAIKLYRQITGSSMAEAKDFIDEILRRRGMSPGRPWDPSHANWSD